MRRGGACCPDAGRAEQTELQISVGDGEREKRDKDTESIPDTGAGQGGADLYSTCADAVTTVRRRPPPAQKFRRSARVSTFDDRLQFQRP
jgi:hypothetical protein